MKHFLLCLAYLAFLGILSHFVGEALPRRWFCSESRFFRSADWENNGAFYDKLKIRVWKDKLPDMSRVMPDMMPKRLAGDAVPGDVRQLAVETCVSESVHWGLILLGAACLFLWPGTGGAVITLLYTFGNIPFIMIQRYNRPRLLKTAAILEARRARAEAKAAEIGEV